jgi:hypothetical protein
MQLTRFVAVDVTRPFRCDADPVEDPEEATTLDELDEAAIKRNAQDLVRVIELSGMGKPERRSEIGLRRRVVPLIEALDDLLEHSP